MSFREQRSFIEKLKSLGYPTLVSVDSFRVNNFALVADILFWLCKSYDPETTISLDIATEKERVAFIKSIAIFMSQKANIKLNTRKLYMADGNAVQELLKVALVLYTANSSPDEEDSESSALMDISSKIPQLKKSRNLATEITDKGATLYDLLDREMGLRDIRSQIVARPFDIKEMEGAVSLAIKDIQKEMGETRGILESLNGDEVNLAAKIEKKRLDLDRATKRLGSLKVVRPAYMDEYERIEAEIAKSYTAYMQKYRNLTYIEHQLDSHSKMEQDVKEETEIGMKRMQMRLREEEMRMLRGDDDEEFMGSGDSIGRTRPGAAQYRTSNESIDQREEEDDSDMSEDEDEEVVSGGISMDSSDESEENGGAVQMGTEDSSSGGDDNDF